MWNLSSPTRDRTRVPLQWKHGVLTTGPPGKSQGPVLGVFIETGPSIVLYLYVLLGYYIILLHCQPGV